MAVRRMIVMDNTKKLVAKLTKLGTKARKDSREHILVGFKAYYAIYVHENMQAHHPNGQAKFLEVAAKNSKKEIADIVANAMKSGKALGTALSYGGARLLKNARALTPVKTGFLKKSGFYRVEKINVTKSH